MLRRDFMKALGVFSTTVALPKAARAMIEETSTTTPVMSGRFCGAQPNYSNPGSARRTDCAHDITVTLRSGSKTTTVGLGDGNFTYSYKSGLDLRYERGVLDAVVERQKIIDFDLDGVYNWMQGDLINDTLHNEHDLSMTITFDTFDTYTIEAEGFWTSFSSSPHISELALSGQFTSMELIDGQRRLHFCL